MAKPVLACVRDYEEHARGLCNAPRGLYRRAFWRHSKMMLHRIQRTHRQSRRTLTPH